MNQESHSLHILAIKHTLYFIYNSFLGLMNLFSIIQPIIFYFYFYICEISYLLLITRSVEIN